MSSLNLHIRFGFGFRRKFGKFLKKLRLKEAQSLRTRVFVFLLALMVFTNKVNICQKIRKFLGHFMGSAPSAWYLSIASCQSVVVRKKSWVIHQLEISSKITEFTIVFWVCFMGLWDQWWDGDTICLLDKLQLDFGNVIGFILLLWLVYILYLWIFEDLWYCSWLAVNLVIIGFVVLYSEYSLALEENV